MKLLEKILTFRININLVASLLLSVLASITLTATLFVVQSSSLSDIKECFTGSGYMMPLLNLLPLLAIIFLLFFLANNIVLACGLTGFAALILSIVNRNMIRMRMAPLKPMDLMLGGEFVGIARSIDKRLFFLIGAGIAIFAILFVMCLRFIKTKRMHPSLRIIGAVCSLAAIFIGNHAIYSNKQLYDNMYMRGNFYNEVDNYESKGFIYSFIYTFNTNKITKPENYDKKEIERYLEEFQKRDLNDIQKPNIILVLSEAFSEITLSEHINFDGYEDPLMNYRRIKQDSVSGYIIVPNCGGGTSDTEFDIFTGMSSRHFRGTSYAYNLIKRSCDALPRILASVGYENVAIHPGYTWFYNRRNVYPLLGFDDFIGIESFDQKVTKGMYITETATIDRLIAEYETHVDNSDAPLFEFGLTIQNHGPYKGKYLAEKNFSSDIPFTPDEEDALANYIEGLSDCDRELNRLVEFIDGRDEPVVLIYYGDHLPSFSESIYDSLVPAKDDDGMEGWIRLYKTPYIIYQNQRARDITDMKSKLDMLPADGTMSANYLGPAVLELMGYDGIDQFMDYVNELRKSYPIIWESRYFEPSGEIRELDPSEEHDINFYRRWEYYKIFDE